MGGNGRIRSRFYLGLGTLLLLLTAASPATAAPVQARAADGVVESIGVNTHLGYTDTPYDDFAMVQQRLGELGIRYIREGVSLRRPDVYSRLRTLAADGVHLDVIAGDPLQRWNIGTIDEQLEMIETELLSSVASIEGPNEYDIQGDPGWVPVLRAYTQQLWEALEGRPKLAALPLISPSVTRRENMPLAGDLTPWIDYGNTHTYLSGDIPERDSIWNGEFAQAASNFGKKPVQVTETGYHNAVNSSTSGHQPVSETAAGAYIPRLFLENFNRGIVRSYAYELLDERDDPGRTDIEAAFGLLRNDFSKKPAALAIERLIGLLDDPGARFEPGELDYRLQGAPDSIGQVLLQKRDGSFYLALWNKVSVWDRETRTDIAPPSVPVTLGLEQSIASAEVFDPDVAATPTATISRPSSLDLSLTPRVTVIRLVPTPTPPSEPTPLPPGKPTPGPPVPRPATPITAAPRPVAQAAAAGGVVQPGPSGSPAPIGPGGPAAAAGPPEAQVWTPPQRQGQKNKGKKKKGKKHHRQGHQRGSR
jgi:hypothetical protein